MTPVGNLSSTSLTPCYQATAYARRNFAVASTQGLPQTREEVVGEAGSALSCFLKTGYRVKSFKKSVATKLAVEISLADQSPLSVTQLVAGLLTPLDPDLEDSCTLAFYDIQAALEASGRFENNILSVQDFEAKRQSGVLFIIGVPYGQEAEAQQLFKWRGSAVVLVCFDADSFTCKPSSLRNSFQTVFAFEPFATRGLLRTTQGLVFRRPGEDKSMGPWLIYKKTREEHELIGRVNARPSASDIEMALYNASASASPLVKGIRAIKSLTSRDRPQGQD